MNILICPGIHEPGLTESFVSGLSNFDERATQQESLQIMIFPGQGFSELSSWHIWQFLRDRLGNQLASPIIFISFSAGVVGAIGAAHLWQMWGGQVTAFIAIDGWGVPLGGNFPIHRMSHDYFTHWSSSVLGIGQNNFYADPPVDHLSMWRSPATVQGCWVDPSLEVSPPKLRLTAAEFLHTLLKSYKQK